MYVPLMTRIVNAIMDDSTIQSDHLLAGPPFFALGNTGGACKIAFVALASSPLIPNRCLSAVFGRSTVHPRLLKISLTLDDHER